MAIVLSGVLAISGFAITLYVSYIAVIAYLFATRPLHGAGLFPRGIYVIPWIVAIIVAVLLAIFGWLVAPKLTKSNDRSPKTGVLATVLVLIFIALLAGTVFYCWQKQSDQQNLQGHIDNLQNQLKTADNKIILPDYVAPEQITWITRGEKSTVYAVARPLSSTIRPAVDCCSEFPKYFTGIIKSDDNGKTWQKVYETKNETDILDFTNIGDQNLFLVVTPQYGGGSQEMFIKIAISQDGGDNWSLSKKMAKNDTDKEEDRQPFIYGATGNLIVDPQKNNKSYLLYKDGTDTDSFNKMIYTNNFWQTWQRKDITEF